MTEWSLFGGLLTDSLSFGSRDPMTVADSWISLPLDSLEMAEWCDMDDPGISTTLKVLDCSVDDLSYFIDCKHSPSVIEWNLIAIWHCFTM